MAFSTVLLDLDGTITNPYMGITNGVMYAYEHLGLEVPPRESLRSFIGPPLIVEFTRRGMPEEQAQEAVRLYREYYGETGLFENELIPGTVEFLDGAEAPWEAGMPCDIQAGEIQREDTREIRDRQVFRLYRGG